MNFGGRPGTLVRGYVRNRFDILPNDSPPMKTTVAGMRKGESAVISGISSDDPYVTGRLVSMGVVPGRRVTVLNIVSAKGARVVRIGDSEYAFDIAMASSITVST